MLEWRISHAPISYKNACDWMEDRVEAIARGEAPEIVWFLEHPPLYTVGTSGNRADILENPDGLPVYDTGRGGQVTYHGPGQRIAYALLNLKARGLGPKEFVRCLEQWLISALKVWGVEGFTNPERIGVWTRTHGQEEKIAALGVRIRKGVSFHGVALNNTPNLCHFHQIIPCGLKTFQTTSLQALGLTLSQDALDQTLQETFAYAFPSHPSSPSTPQGF